MDFPPVVPVAVIITLLVPLLLLFANRKLATRTKGGKTHNIDRHAPELPGALPLVGHLHLLWGSDPPFRKFSAMADRLGPIFSLRLGLRHTVVISDWENARMCLAVNDKALASRADIAGGRHMGYDRAVFALSPYGDYFRLIRKIATVELLSNLRLEKLGRIRASEVDALTKHLFSHAKPSSNSTAVTISEMLEHLTFNINLRMVAGKRFRDEEFEEVNSDAWRFKRAINKSLHLFGVFVLSDVIPWLEWIDFQGHLRAMKETAREFDFVLGKWLQEHVLKKRLAKEGANGEEGAADFMDVLLDNLPEDDILFGHKREDIVKATAMILILTGSESTSITMTWVLSLLLNNPASLKLAQQELDACIGRDRWVQESDITKLTYFQAILKETLRLYPAAPLTGIREAIEDCNLNGHHVPKGTWVIVNLWKLHRDPRVWSEPDVFRPERFLGEHKEVNARGSQNFEFLPFSSGRRSCPGATLGLNVVHLTLARILQGFDVMSGDGVPVDMTEGLGIALPKVNPLRVVLKPRLPLGLYESL